MQHLDLLQLKYLILAQAHLVQVHLDFQLLISLRVHQMQLQKPVYLPLLEMLKVHLLNCQQNELKNIEEKIDTTNKKRKSSAVPLKAGVKKNFNEYIKGVFRHSKEISDTKIESITRNFLKKSNEGKQELAENKGEQYAGFYHHRMCDLRGRTRKLFAERAEEFYVNGESVWPNPQDTVQVIEDAPHIMFNAYGMKHKLTENDVDYAKNILVEWIENGGKLLNKKEDKNKTLLDPSVDGGFQGVKLMQN